MSVAEALTAVDQAALGIRNASARQADEFQTSLAVQAEIIAQLMGEKAAVSAELDNALAQLTGHQLPTLPVTVELLPPRRIIRSFGDLADNTELLLTEGTYEVATPIVLSYRNVVIRCINPASQITLDWTATTQWASIMRLTEQSRDVTIRGIRFDTSRPSDINEHGDLPFGIVLGGSGHLIERCQFDRVNYGINGEAAHSDVRILHCTAPLETGVRGYLYWGGNPGSTARDVEIAYCRMINSRREHCIRVAECNGLSIHDNDLQNLAFSDTDPQDTAKSAIWVMTGDNVLIQNNRCRGNISVGPLPIDTRPDAALRNVQVLNNTVTDAEVQVMRGIDGADIRGNYIKRDGVGAVVLLRKASAPRTIRNVTVADNAFHITRPEPKEASRGVWVQDEATVDGLVISGNRIASDNGRLVQQPGETIVRDVSELAAVGAGCSLG